MMEKTALINIPKMLLELGWTKSISEGKRLVDQGAVKIYPPKRDTDGK